MAGLLGYALAGALTGAGQGIAEQARMRREEALEEVRQQRRQAEREQDREWQVEDRDLAHSRRARGGGGGSGSTPAAVQTLEHNRRIAWQEAGSPTDDDGNPLYTRDINDRAVQLMGRNTDIGGGNGNMSILDLSRAEDLADARARRLLGIPAGGRIPPDRMDEYTSAFEQERDALTSRGSGASGPARSTPPPQVDVPAGDEALPPAPRTAADRTVGQRYRAPNGDIVIWRGNGWEVEE